MREVDANGFLFVADPHVAAVAPGQRTGDYPGQVLAKLETALAHAAADNLVPVFLGDLFHWPRDNPNGLLVRLIELFAPHRPLCLVGNHDKYLARFTPDCSLSVLGAAGAVRIVSEPGPSLFLRDPKGRTCLLFAVPDGCRFPRSVARQDADTVILISHHDVAFPDFQAGKRTPREIEGVDMVVNGHIHRPQPSVTAGGTSWHNPGNVTRLTFTQHTKTRVPVYATWRPGEEGLTPHPLPLAPFADVFPGGEPPASMAIEARSTFLAGLERLASRRTREGLGLREALSHHISPDAPYAGLLWDLYQEVIDAPDEHTQGRDE